MLEQKGEGDASLEPVTEPPVVGNGKETSGSLGCALFPAKFALGAVSAFWGFGVANRLIDASRAPRVPFPGGVELYTPWYESFDWGAVMAAFVTGSIGYHIGERLEQLTLQGLRHIRARRGKRAALAFSLAISAATVAIVIWLLSAI